MHKSFISAPLFGFCVSAELLSRFSEFCTVLPQRDASSLSRKTEKNKRKCTFKNRDKGDTSGCKIVQFCSLFWHATKQQTFQQKKPSQLSQSPSFQSFSSPAVREYRGFRLEINFSSLSRTHTGADWINGRQLFFHRPELVFAKLENGGRTSQKKRNRGGRFHR